MAKCMWCKVPYWACVDDAGTDKESFCSDKCRDDYNESLDAFLLLQEDNSESDDWIPFDGQIPPQPESWLEWQGFGIDPREVH